MKADDQREGGIVHWLPGAQQRAEELKIIAEVTRFGLPGLVVYAALGYWQAWRARRKAQRREVIRWW